MNPIDKAKNVAKFQEGSMQGWMKLVQQRNATAKRATRNPWEGTYNELPEDYKKIVNDLAKQMNYNSSEVAQRYDNGDMAGVLYARYKNAPSARVRQNDSPTSSKSMELEDDMNKMLYHSIDRALPNMKYAIPYIEELEIKVPGVGRTTTNALDSLAKYAPIAGIPLEEALGIAAQETAFGALPQYNYVEVEGTEEEKQKAREFNRALGNASYFRNYGLIPAENFVRDFAYNMAKEPVDRNVPPLLHAFNYWKKGMYNRNDPNHTNDVIRKGKEVMATPVIQNWIKQSEFAQKAIK